MKDARLSPQQAQAEAGGSEGVAGGGAGFSVRPPVPAVPRELLKGEMTEEPGAERGERPAPFRILGTREGSRKQSGALHAGARYDP
jgi:hypothetical protein